MNAANAQKQVAPTRRGCLFYVKRGLIGLGIVLIALVVLGMAFQALAVQLDKRNYPPPGKLYTVNGHLMHLSCKGDGDPTVILQSGGAADSTWWYWIQNQLAEHTRVCAFDRPGMGWSEPTTEPRDALTLASELRTLLAAADVRPPYVMAGHSWGAVLARIYAAQYPTEIKGIVLIDSALVYPKHFADQNEYDAWKSTFAGQQTLFGIMMRLGLPRLTEPTIFKNAGYPPEVALELVAMHSRNEVIDIDYEEFHSEMWALTEASATAENLGDLPLAVLWAPETWKGQDTFLPELPAARAEISAYSTNSVTRSIDGADHASILGNEQYAQQVSDAIRDVMEAARTHQPIASKQP
ncbi:MAG TPA: alpha/beta hydrolase [Anaerolineae bacterium]|nr:alpha/beta hydrolase [Anaerolineae bacterium]